MVSGDTCRSGRAWPFGGAVPNVRGLVAPPASGTESQLRLLSFPSSLSSIPSPRGKLAV